MTHCLSSQSFDTWSPNGDCLGRSRKIGLAKGTMSLGTGFESPKVQAILSSPCFLIMFEM